MCQIRLGNRISVSNNWFGFDVIWLLQCHVFETATIKM